MTFEARAGGGLDRFAEKNGADGSPARQSKLPVLVIMHGEASSAGRIGQLLQQRGHALDIRKPRFGGTLPETLEGHAGVVVFGGPMSCNDPDDYLKREIDFLGLVLKQQKPFLGVCLGAQMLAKQLGSEVGKHPEGRVEIGYHAIAPTPAGHAFGPWPSRVYQWHREGFTLPTGCTRLAEGEVFENQAFSHGANCLGLQFHPEITYTLVNRWTCMAKDWAGKPGAQVRADQLDGHLLNSRTVSGWLDKLLDVWLGSRVLAAWHS